MILLDTHAWIWYVTESKHLSVRARRAIEREEQAGVSAISCWEAAMLVEKKRIAFTLDIKEWVRIALEYPKIILLPILPEIAVASTVLPGAFHSDPADRFIAATSIHYNIPLITKDQRIRKYPYVKTIW